MAALWWALTLSAVTPSAASAATAASTDNMPPVASPAGSSAGRIEPIAVTQIIARADEDQQRVEHVRRLLAAPDPAERLRQSLNDIAGPVNSKLNGPSGGSLRGMPVMHLESLQRHWEFDARRLARWEQSARRALAPYAQSALDLAHRRATWSATRAAGLLEGLPPAMATRVDDILAQIDLMETQLGAALDRHFALMQRASEIDAWTRTGRDGVAAAIEEVDRRLLEVDAPPLWRGGTAPVGLHTALAAMHEGLEVESQFAVDYQAANTVSQQVLRLVQLMLLPLILFLFVRTRRAQASWRSAPPSPSSAAMSSPSSSHSPPTAPPASASRVSLALQRPFSTWLLLSMMAVLVLEPDAPLLAHEAAMLLALVPVLRLMPPAAVRALGLWPVIAVGLYLIDRVGVAVVAEASLYRLYVLALSLLALILTVWLLRHPLASRTPAEARWRRWGRPMGWTAAVLLSLAVVCNAFGNVSMAEMLTSDLIDSGYMALMLYAAVSATLGLLQAIIEQPEVAGVRFVRRHWSVVQSVVTRGLVLGAVMGWALYALHRFRLLRPLHDAGVIVLGWGVEVGEVSIHVGDVLVFALANWLAFWAARAVRSLLRDELPAHAGLPRGAGNSIASLSYYSVLLIGMLVALSAAGFKVGQLTLVLGALGVGIGFGLQNLVNNFVSGLVLMFERPIQPGDVVEVGAVAGTVSEIGLRATTLRTYDGADVIVPNGSLLSANLTNWTLFDRSRRFEVVVNTAYGSDPAQVIALLERTARETPGMAAHPPPLAQFTGYGDSALNFVVRAWTEDVAHWGAMRSELLTRILSALAAANISIPYNQLDIHLQRQTSPAAPPRPPQPGTDGSHRSSPGSSP